MWLGNFSDVPCTAVLYMRTRAFPPAAFRARVSRYSTRALVTVVPSYAITVGRSSFTRHGRPRFIHAFPAHVEPRRKMPRFGNDNNTPSVDLVVREDYGLCTRNGVFTDNARFPNSPLAYACTVDLYSILLTRIPNVLFAFVFLFFFFRRARFLPAVFPPNEPRTFSAQTRFSIFHSDFLDRTTALSQNQISFFPRHF